MTRVRPTGFSLPPGFGLQWEFVDSDKEIARKTIIFLENRRLLCGGPSNMVEDALHCVRSAIEIRTWLTDLIPSAHEGGGVEQSLRAIRAACTRFVNKAGREGMYFRREVVNSRGFGGASSFGKALGELRSLVGIQVALLADKYKLEVEESLLSIFPPSGEQNLSWVPGFDVEG
jgi:hypothetical protein